MEYDWFGQIQFEKHNQYTTPLGSGQPDFIDKRIPTHNHSFSVDSDGLIGSGCIISGLHIT